MKIPLSFRGKVVEVEIDAEDAERILEHRWHVKEIHGQLYVGHSERWGTVYLHRWLAGAEGRAHVRFRDGNTLNCRKANLRLPGRP